MQHGCMATSITISDVPDEARDELAARAARRGESLEMYLRAELIALTSKPDIDALNASIEARKRRAGSSLTGARIIEYRDAGRRG